MLLLLFNIKEENFAIDATNIVEIVPYLLPKTIQHTPDYVLGLVNYRTKPVPVIDLGQMLEKVPCKKMLSTRIIMINFPVSPSRNRVLGLLAENVTETKKTPKDWRPPQFDKFSNGAVTIDSSFIDSQTMIHWFSPEQMLPSTKIKNIFREIS